MSESRACINAKGLLQKVSLSKQLFEQAYDDFLRSKNEQDRDLVHAAKKELEKKILALQEVVSSARMEYLIEVLGRENVHGPEDVALLLGFVPKDVPPIPYTHADLQKSKEIKKNTGVEEMLVLIVNDRDGNPLTGETLNALVQKKYEEMGLGKFLFNSTGWYKDETFYKELGLTVEWKLVTKTCLPDSYSKRHHFEKGDTYKYEDTQEFAIERFAAKVGIPRDELKRPDPFAMIYTIALHLVATEKLKGKGNGERLLETKYHWSDVKVSDGGFVGVGGAARDGVHVYRGSRDDASDDFGVCLSR